MAYLIFVQELLAINVGRHMEKTGSKACKNVNKTFFRISHASHHIPIHHCVNSIERLVFSC